MKKPDDIDALDKQIKKFKQKERLNKIDEQKEPEYSSAATGFQISTELLAGVAIGAAIGYVFDNVFNSAPWCLAIFTILGGVAGMLNIYKTFKVDDKDVKE